MAGMQLRWAALAGAAGLALASCHPGVGQGLHEALDERPHAALHDDAPPAGGGQTTMQLQGNDAAAWAADPNMRAFYEATRVAFAGGPDKVDVPAYEGRAKAIFNDFAASRGVDPTAMQDHLKAIPMQMVQIVRDDPKVLDSFENFRVALFGPE